MHPLHYLKISDGSSLTNDTNRDLTPVGAATVLKKKKALPSTQSHPAIDHWNHFTGPGERHADVTWHIIRPFEGVHKIRSILRDQMIKKGFQISPRTGIRILHDHQAGRGMAHKNGNGPSLNSTPCHHRSDFSSNLIGPLPLRLDME